MSIHRFLKQRAVSIAVDGSYVLPNWYDAQGKRRTFACRTNRVSPFRMIVDAPVVGRIGDTVESYFGDFGKLDGHISDTKSSAFLLELDIDKTMRERISNQLTWLEQRQADPSIRDARAQPRSVPASPYSMLAFSDGSTRPCFVIDMSASGVAVSADVQPEIGTALAVGSCVGRVVRHLPSGFAVQFTELQHRGELERRLTRTPPPDVHLPHPAGVGGYGQAGFGPRAATTTPVSTRA